MGNLVDLDFSLSVAILFSVSPFSQNGQKTCRGVGVKENWWVGSLFGKRGRPDSAGSRGAILFHVSAETTLNEDRRRGVGTAKSSGVR
uniref:Uncharacterized protein n=1 Tax=Chromera velia CCMP2878 TaxID=1169474 RepID=A0A0G4H2M2_9ALVE|eukprot:Cvel_24455.t1-p1 / transcript=Cvel_24455.t1 / gene=Cvel_24455 / organism=Chromera_velia_CCMP2878 / gene_product=hypothetical protein / transcript_product=hypothetical protein / location=Cvel_scaffold2644:19954-22843(-) / protein_length=87 / sequence_SO=supercontig / SO=protein_coding / is_pseudo=false